MKAARGAAARRRTTRRRSGRCRRSACRLRPRGLRLARSPANTTRSRRCYAAVGRKAQREAAPRYGSRPLASVCQPRRPEWPASRTSRPARPASDGRGQPAADPPRASSDAVVDAEPGGHPHSAAAPWQRAPAGLVDQLAAVAAAPPWVGASTTRTKPEWRQPRTKREPPRTSRSGWRSRDASARCAWPPSAGPPNARPLRRARSRSTVTALAEGHATAARSGLELERGRSGVGRSWVVLATAPLSANAEAGTASMIVAIAT